MTGLAPGAARSSRPDHDWVQPILVAKDGTHADTVRAVAQASFEVWSRSHDGSPFPRSNYEHWLAGPFTKTVRRASKAQMSGLIQFWAKENRIPYAAVEIGASVAVAFPPMRYADMPKQIAKFQVSGTDFPRASAAPDPDGALVHAIVDTTLTTGKAAAAAAHAVWAWALPLAHSDDPDTEDAVQAWEDARFQVTVRFAAAVDLADLAQRPGACPIVDAGLTEVAPSTLTAVGAAAAS